MVVLSGDRVVMMSVRADESEVDALRAVMAVDDMQAEAERTERRREPSDDHGRRGRP